MVDTYKPYLSIVRDSLLYALSIRNFPSQKFEKINRPQVEVEENDCLVNKPITIARSEDEKVLIESSINSVRVSICVKKHSELEKMIVRIFTKFLMNRANKLNILRKKPIENYDISFLITNYHLEIYKKEDIVNFIVHFIQDLVKDITEMKLTVNTQARFCTSNFINNFNV